LNHRERVLSAVRHEIPDRVPIGEISMEFVGDDGNHPAQVNGTIAIVPYKVWSGIRLCHACQAKTGRNALERSNSSIYTYIED